VNRLLLALLLPLLLPAQNTKCSLSGTVYDSAGAVVPHAVITLTGQVSGFVRTALTSQEGFFSFPDLTPAIFVITIEAEGFKIFKETGIRIDGGEGRSLDTVKLEVGQPSDVVTVSAPAVSVNVQNGERSGTFSGEQIEELTLRGSDLFNALSLIGGVVDTSDGRDSPSPDSISNISIAGGRDDQKNMTVDGVSNLDTGSNGSLHSMPSLGAVGEVKVLVSAYSAESGRNPYSINVITRGGGNQLHGQAQFSFRNEDLNANNFFSNKQGQPRQRYRYNIGSYSLGGPVVLPRIYRNKRNLFFFFNQEFQNQVVTYGVEEKTVPTALERTGNFSKSVDTNGNPIVIDDPLNAKAPFPGNLIPASRISSVGQAILNLFPSPNFVDPNIATRYNWNYYVAASEPYNRSAETARIDYAPLQSWQVYFSFTNNADHQNVPYNSGGAGFAAGSLNFLLSPMHFEQPGRLATVHSTNTLTPTLSNQASVAFSQNSLTFEPEFPNLMNRSLLGIDIPQRNPALNPLNLIPAMTFGGIPNYANPSTSAGGTPYHNQNSVYSGIDNLSKVEGSHVFQIGIYFEHAQKIQSANVQNNGLIHFDQDTNNPNDSNNAYANALLGNYDSYSEPLAQPQSNYLFNNTEWFFQDDWRARSRLSISWGVRFHHDPPLYDSHQLISSFSPAAWNPAQAPVLIRPAVVGGTNVGIDPTTLKVYPQGEIGDFVPGIGNTADGMVIGGKNGTPAGFFATAPVSVGPRLGLAWDPFGDGKSVIRGGAGIYFDRIQGNPVTSLAGNPPSVYTPSSYYGTLAGIASSASSALLAPSATVYSLSSVPHQQQVYNFNLAIERRIGSNLLSAGYTGSLGRHLLWQRNINAVPEGADFLNLNPQNVNPQSTGSALSANYLRPYSAYGDIYLREFAGTSNYNAFLIQLQHSFAKNFSLGANYTFSKALDEADGYGSSVDPFLNPRSRNYGPAGFNRSQVFTASFYYSFPKVEEITSFRPLAWVADGWAVTGILRILTGAPITPGYSLVTGINQPTGSPSDTARMEVINPSAPLASRFGPPPEPAGQATLATAAWLSTSTAPQFGDLGQNTMTGPGTNNWDLSLLRTFRISERVRSMLRLDAYNAFNHTQFNGIYSAAQFNTVGQQVNTAFLLPNSARPARIAQIALRLSF